MKIISLIRYLILIFPKILFYQLFFKIFPITILRNKAAITPYNEIRIFLLKKSGIPIGKNSTIGFGSLIIGRSKNPPALNIGNRVAIGPKCNFITSSFPDNSSLSFNEDTKKFIKKLSPIIVEDDAWIGAGVTILPGIKIGKSSIIGAGSVVTKDIKPFCVYAGNPARLLKRLNHENKDNK